MIDARHADHVDPVPSAEEWGRLSLEPRKRSAYATDIYFRECWADLVDVLGESGTQGLGALALLSFKPDGLIGRRMTPALEFLLRRGFVPVSVAAVRLTRHSMRALWHYNWDVYPADRLALATLMHSAADTLVLLLHDSEFDGAIPGSVRLASLKGPAAPEKRIEGQLREALRPPNAVVNFVHVADEPADLVRELGIFLGRAERRHHLAEIGERPSGDATPEVREAIAALESRYPAHDFDFERTVARLELEQGLCEAVGARLRDAASGGPKIAWEDLRELIGSPGEDASVWDFICIASSVLVEERPGSPELLPSAAIGDWARAAGDGGSAARG